jgi:hypothetical protein
MRKYLPVILIPALFVLDWLALDDITTGNEPDLTAEYIIHTFASVVIGYVVIQKTYVFLYHLQKNVVTKSVIPFKYHVHHDFIGLLMIIFGFFITPAWLQITFTGIGLGLIIHHVQTEGFRLVTKF